VLESLQIILCGNIINIYVVKYIRKFNEALAHSNGGFDVKYVSMIIRLYRIAASDPDWEPLFDSIKEYFEENIQYLPSGLWEVKKPIIYYMENSRTVSFNIGTLLFIDKSKIKYSADRGSKWWDGWSIDFKDEYIAEGNKIRGMNQLYYAFYLGLKPLDDYSVINNVKINNPGVYSEITKLFGEEGTNSATKMGEMGF